MRELSLTTKNWSNIFCCGKEVQPHCGQRNKVQRLRDFVKSGPMHIATRAVQGEAPSHGYPWHRGGAFETSLVGARANAGSEPYPQTV